MGEWGNEEMGKRGNFSPSSLERGWGEAIVHLYSLSHRHTIFPLVFTVALPQTLQADVMRPSGANELPPSGLP